MDWKTREMERLKKSRRGGGGIGGFVLAQSGLPDRPVSSTAIGSFSWQPSQHTELVQTDCFKRTCVVTNYWEGEIWIPHCGDAKHCAHLVSDTRVFPAFSCFPCRWSALQKTEILQFTRHIIWRSFCSSSVTNNPHWTVLLTQYFST